MLRFVGISSLIGLVLPLLLSGIWKIIEGHPRVDISLGYWLVKLQLLIWPSSIFMMAETGHRSNDLKLFGFSLTANVLLYAIVGLLIWWGLNKHCWILAVVAVLVVLGWWKLLTL